MPTVRRATEKPTMRAIREPQMNWLKMSRPCRSVPQKYWLPDGYVPGGIGARYLPVEEIAYTQPFPVPSKTLSTKRHFTVPALRVPTASRAMEYRIPVREVTYTVVESMNGDERGPRSCWDTVSMTGMVRTAKVGWSRAVGEVSHGT